MADSGQLQTLMWQAASVLHEQVHRPVALSTAFINQATNRHLKVYIEPQYSESIVSVATYSLL